MISKKKVFLSSAQYGDEFAAERAALPYFFKQQPMHSIFELWRIEDYASPDTIGNYCNANSSEADILLLLIGKELRPAVRNEYDAAISKNRNIFVFSKKNCSRTPELETFVKEILFKKHAVVSYDEFNDLAKKLEDSFLSFYMNPSNQREPTSNKKLFNADNRKERGLRLLVGILSTSSATSMEEKVFESLVQEALLENPAGITKEEIIAYIVRILESKPDSVISKIENTIKTLASINTVNLNQNTRISLKETEISRLNQIRQKADEGEDALIRQFYQRKPIELKSIDFTIFKKVLLRVISCVVHESAIAMSEISLHGDKSPFAYDADAVNQIVANALLSEIDLHGMISEWQACVLDVLLSSNPIVINWLNRLRKGYWLLATAGRDPDAINCAAEHLKGYCIYLDSHLVIRAMVNAGGESKMCKDILRVSAELGVQTRLSEPMYSEVETAFSSANKAVQVVHGEIQRVLDFFKTINRKTDIIDGFLSAKASISSLTWESFLSPFYSIQDSNVLLNYIKEELHVIVESKQTYNENQLGKIEGIVELLMKKRNIPMNPYQNPNKRSSRDWEAQYSLRSNEARQMAIIYESRKKTEQPGMQYWFVSFDSFVYEVSAKLASSNDSFFKFPCCMKPGRWLDILVNASPKPLNINTFREILLSPAIKHAADYIESEVIAQMLQSRIDKEVHHLSTLQNMFDQVVNRQAVQDAFGEIYRAERGMSKIKAIDHAKDTIIDALHDEVTSLKQIVVEKEKTAIEANKLAKKEQKRAKYYKDELTKQLRGKPKKHY